LVAFHCSLGFSLGTFHCSLGFSLGTFHCSLGFSLGTFHCRPGFSLGTFHCRPGFSLPAVRVHPMGYQEGGHMTSCLKGLFLNGDGTYLNLPNQKMRNISGMLERAPLVSIVPYNYIIIDLNKP
jgi:hypothetical protein